MIHVGIIRLFYKYHTMLIESQFTLFLDCNPELGKLLG